MRKTSQTHLLLRLRQRSVEFFERSVVRLVQRRSISFSPARAFQTASLHLHEHRERCVEEMIAGTLDVRTMASLLGHHCLEKIRRRSRVCKQVDTTACGLRAVDGIAVRRSF